MDAIKKERKEIEDEEEIIAENKGYETKEYEETYIKRRKHSPSKRTSHPHKKESPPQVTQQEGEGWMV